MASLKGLALGLTAIVAVGYIATRTGAAKGISGVAQAATEAFMAPFKGIGEGLATMGEGISKVLSPVVAPTFAPKFDWSGWMPFGPGPSKNGNGVREEDRNNGNGLFRVLLRAEEQAYTPTPTLVEPGYTPRVEDRRTRLIML